MVNFAEIFIEMGSDSTKEKIVQAAKQIFIRKGMDGARMQEIADEAGINKAMLHYYFHSKDQLFNEVFYGILSQLIPGLIVIFKADEPFLDKIEAIVSEYDSYMSKNPFLPQFVFREINRDPEQLSRFMSDKGLNFELVESMINREVSDGNIRHITFPHLFANLIGMIVMPYIGRPLFQRKLFKNDPVKYDQFLQERKAVITRFVKQALGVGKVEN
jgi:TetR/AcrR family transcriptional regulator